jgi:hypothetical protein
MASGDGNDVFVVDASALGGLTLADLIADYAPGPEIVDLSGLIDSLLEGPAGQPGAEAAPVITSTGTDAEQVVSAPGETTLDLAGLSGISHTITILYDDTLTTGI